MMDSDEASLKEVKNSTNNAEQLNCNDKTMNPELSSSTIESKNNIEQNSSNPDEPNGLMECEEMSDDKDTVQGNGHTENKNDCTSNGIADGKRNNSSETSKPFEELCGNSAEKDKHSDILDDSQKIDQCTASQVSTSTVPNEESSDDSGPSCSNTRFYKAKSKVIKRHYRKKSDDNEDMDVNGGKKARDDRRSSGDELSSTPAPEPESRQVDDPEEDKESDSDDERSSSEKVDDSNEWTTVSEDDLDNSMPSVLKKQKPKPKWFVIPDLVNREIGNNQFLDRKFYGSLHVVQRLELMQKLESHEGCVNALNFNEGGNLLASASDDTKVVIWDWAIGKAQNIYATGHTMNIFEVKWLPIDFESLVVTCSRDGHVRLLDLRTNTHRGLATHRQEARRLAVHPEHPYGVLSVGDDGKVLSIDIRAPKPTKLLTVKEGRSNTSLYTIHINPRNSNEFCVAGRSQWVKIYDRRRNLEPIQQRSPQNLQRDNKTAYVTSAVYNYNGTEIVASYNDDDIYLFDTVLSHPNGDYAHKYEGHRNCATVKSVNFFGPKSEFIVSGSDCGNIFFWDKNTEAIVQWMAGDEQGVVNRLEPHPHVPILATSGLDHDVKIWIPSCEKPPHMANLESCVRSNQQNRADEITNEPDAYDSQVLMFFLRSIRQYGQRSNNPRSRITSRNYLFDGGSDSSSDSASTNSDNLSDDGNEGPQCSPS